jgi:hypothetical protein
VPYCYPISFNWLPSPLDLTAQVAGALVASGKLRTFDCLGALEGLHKVVPDRLFAAALLPGAAPAPSRSMGQALGDGETGPREIGAGEIADREIADREMDSRRLADRAMGSPELGPVSSAISLAAFSGRTAWGTA